MSLIELVSTSCHSHQSSPSPQSSLSQLKACEASVLLPWQLDLLGPIDQYSLPLARLCCKPSKRDRSTDHAAPVMDGWVSCVRFLS